MYKTVRHGENSLQYTILPQTEEVLNNSGLRGKGRDYSPSIHVRRSRRRSTVKYILLIIFGIIVALALASIPLYVMSGALSARRNQHGQQELITTAPFAPSGREIAKTRKKELKISPDVISTMESKLEISTTTTPSTTASTLSPTVTSERATSPPWMPALKSWKSLTPSTTIRPIVTEENEAIPFIGTSSSNNHLIDRDMALKPWEKDVIIRATVTPEPITLRSVIKYYSRSSVPSEKSIVRNTKAFDDVLITTKGTTTRTPVSTDFTTTSEKYFLKDLKDTMLSVDDDDEFKESLEVDEVFSLPPLKPDSAAPSLDIDEVTVSKTGTNWFGPRWPFVDSSTYIQWSGYAAGDNPLLPLLVAFPTSVALMLLVALAVRRRKRSHMACAQNGKLTAELQADDNTNLLTAENAEDADE